MVKTLRTATAVLDDLRSSRLVRVIVLGLAILGYALISLEPFEWSPPRRVENGAVWTDRSSLLLTTEGLVVGRSAPDWLAPAVRNQEIVIDLRFTPSVTAQWGEILAMGGEGRRRNLAISQKNRHLIVRVRRTCTRLQWLELACTTGRVVRSVVEAGRSTDLQLALRPARLTLSVDGKVVLERALTGRPLDAWNTGQHLALGNDTAGSWPWLGVIERAEVRTPGVQADLLDPELYRMPQRYWAFSRDPRLVPFWNSPLRDMMNNLVMYVPFGVLLALLGLWTRWSGVLWALLTTATVSLAMEIGQIFVTREPSVTDLLLNSAGGAFGFALIQAIRTDPRIRRLVARIVGPRLRPREQEG